MIMEITEWHRNNPNDWVATDRVTCELVDRDDNLSELDKRIVAKGLKDSIVYSKNWHSPHHYAKENAAGIERSRIWNEASKNYLDMDDFTHCLKCHKPILRNELIKHGDETECKDKPCTRCVEGNPHCEPFLTFMKESWVRKMIDRDIP